MNCARPCRNRRANQHAGNQRGANAGFTGTSDFTGNAQKGLVSKINKDAPLLAKSRLPALESALSNELIPAKQDIIRSQLMAEINELASSKTGVDVVAPTQCC
jgi:hypothetical protein